MSASTQLGRIDLASILPEEQWRIYERVLNGAAERHIPFAIGGALALGAYTGRWRNTKDIDLYILPADRGRVVKLFSDCGLADYYDTLAYDRRWIYRAHSGNCIVDAIWSMANQRASVDEGWLTRGREIDCASGVRLRVLPAEELIWSKLYVMQRERCDWPDVLNLLYASSATLDWDHLIRRVGDDLPLLKGVLTIFAWICPSCLADIPATARRRLDLRASNAPATKLDEHRIDLLDSRPWFGPDAKAA